MNCNNYKFPQYLISNNNFLKSLEASVSHQIKMLVLHGKFDHNQ